jgi:hypothetical protein
MSTLAFTASAQTTNNEIAPMKTLTPVLMVEEIEPMIPFWEALGFVKILEVPDGDRLGFVGLLSGSVQIMYQTVETVRADAPMIADSPMGGTMLFIEVDDLDAVAEGLGDTEYLIPRRTTFYGADEIVVREPGGNIVTFAKMSGTEEGAGGP